MFYGFPQKYRLHSGTQTDQLRAYKGYLPQIFRDYRVTRIPCTRQQQAFPRPEQFSRGDTHTPLLDSLYISTRLESQKIGYTYPGQIHQSRQQQQSKNNFLQQSQPQ